MVLVPYRRQGKCFMTWPRSNMNNKRNSNSKNSNVDMIPYHQLYTVVYHTICSLSANQQRPPYSGHPSMPLAGPRILVRVRVIQRYSLPHNAK